MAAMSSAPSRQEYELWFKDADKNSDGVLTAKELKKMFKFKGYKTSSKVFKRVFAVLDADSDKKVTLEEYLTAVNQLSDDQLESMRDVSSSSDSDDDVTSARPTTTEEFEKWFKEADKNNDGFLTAKELKKMFKVKGYKYSRKAFKEQFANLDVDGDKKITLQEYLKVMTKVPEAEITIGSELVEAGSRQQYENWFREADKNSDGFLTAKELKRMLKSKGIKMSGKAVKNYFDALDRDKDKKVSLREYLEAMGHVTTDVSDESESRRDDPLAAFRPSGVDVEPSKQAPAAGSEPSKQAPAAGNEPSKQAPATGSEPSKQAPAAGSEPSKQAPVTGSEPSKQAPSAGSEPSKQAPPAGSEPSKQAPAAEGVPFEQSPVAHGEQTHETPAVAKQTPAAGTAQPEQSPAGQREQSEQVKGEQTTHCDESTETSNGSVEIKPIVSESEIRALFEEADTNGDGLLDVEEMREVLKRTHVGLTNKQLFDIMHEADTNRTGQIDFNEFIVLWLREHGILKD